MKISPDKINNLLPQTQCGDCDYAGCKPYAEAITQGDAINKCLPGGVKILRQLGELLKMDYEKYVEDMQQKAKPKRLAVIREQECIGCTKCIQACPVDAILGAGKYMHTIIASECTGCELCIAPCPMDCIDMVAIDDQNYYSDYTKMRYENRLARLAAQQQEAQLKQAEKKLASKRAAIQAAVQRARQRSEDRLHDPL